MRLVRAGNQRLPILSRRSGMALGIVLGSLAAIGCAPVIKPAAPVAVAAPPAVARPSGDVALFVRDATGRSFLPGAVCSKLGATGVRCRALTPASTSHTPWSVDAEATRAAGAAFTFRVTVIQRREDIEEVNRAEGVLVPASGAIGRQTLVGAGDPHRRDDLRLEVIASLRRAGDGQPLERWSESEGMLDDGDDKNLDARWAALYDEVADRLAARAAAALSRPR